MPTRVGQRYTTHMSQLTTIPVARRTPRVVDILNLEQARPLPEIAPPSFDEYAARVSETGPVRRGVPQPLGAHELEGGVNFALLSRHARRVLLDLFESAQDVKPSKTIELDPARNRTGDIWHVWLKGVGAGQVYSYRVTLTNTSTDHAERQVVKLDPYATSIYRCSGDAPPRGIVTRADFDWQDDTSPRHPWSKTVIYETHLRGLTAHPSSEVACPGTFRALAEKVPYFKDLGVTTVELMPIQEFDASRCTARDPVTGRRLADYWGYENPLALFAPNSAYSSVAARGEQIAEFKEMVRRLHLSGIELIIDITFPHANGTVGPVARQFIIDALRYWVAEMHVDGFRLDLAFLLGRNSSGSLANNPRLLEEIAEDPVLRHTKLITAGWEPAGAYEMDSFSERRWAEWNRRYRDDVRRFWRGDTGMSGAFASRICGSEDLYGQSGKGPEISVNFVTCHDGFTLNDLVTYQLKHNQANGEPASGATPDEFSANYGMEGPTTDPRIEALRKRQIKSLLLTLFVSRGVPMLLGGDEFRRTQSGNSNAWCQDNATSWYDWRLLQHDAGTHDFVKRMIALRREHPVLSREAFYTAADIRWCAPDLGLPDWGDPRRKSLGCLIRASDQGAIYLMFNAEDTPMTFRIPFAPPRQQWRLVIDTAADLPAPGAGPVLAGGTRHTLAPRSSAILTTTRDETAAAHAPASSVGFTACGCNHSIEDCARAMGGDDPDLAYAAAMLWYQGYPDVPESGKQG